MVGEMRDLETIQLALNLAETGHMIIGPLHTKDATHAIRRTIDVFPSDQFAAKSLLSLFLKGAHSAHKYRRKCMGSICSSSEVE